MASRNYFSATLSYLLIANVFTFTLHQIKFNISAMWKASPQLYNLRTYQVEIFVFVVLCSALAIFKPGMHQTAANARLVS